MIETPEYLKELIGDYRSATQKGRWIDAATKVEDYRHRHVITDLGSAFGVEPPGAERSPGSTHTTTSRQPLSHRQRVGGCGWAETYWKVGKIGQPSSCATESEFLSLDRHVRGRMSPQDEAGGEKAWRRTSEHGSERGERQEPASTRWRTT